MEPSGYLPDCCQHSCVGTNGAIYLLGFEDEVMQEILNIIRTLRKKIARQTSTLANFGKARQQAQLDILDVVERKIIELYEKGEPK